VAKPFGPPPRPPRRPRGSCPTGGGCAARAGWKPALPGTATAGGDRCPRPTERPAGIGVPALQNDRRGSVSPPYRTAGGDRCPRPTERPAGIGVPALQNGRRGSVSPPYRTTGGDRCPRPTERPAGDDSASAASCRSNNGVAPGGARRAGGKWLSPSGRHPGRHGGLGAPAPREAAAPPAQVENLRYQERRRAAGIGVPALQNDRRGSVSPPYRTTGGDRCPRPTERPAGDDSASAASCRSNNP